MEASVLASAHMLDARLWGANLDMALLHEAKPERADFTGAKLRGAVLDSAQMQGAQLVGVSLDSKTYLKDARFAGACFWETDLRGTRISLEQVAEAFSDRSVELPRGFDFPGHWPDLRLSPFGGTDFSSQWRKWQSDPQG